jgi:hypothetical protein
VSSLYVQLGDNPRRIIQFYGGDFISQSALMTETNAKSEGLLA